MAAMTAAPLYSLSEEWKTLHALRAAERPMMFHCKSGADRAGFLVPNPDLAGADSLDICDDEFTYVRFDKFPKGLGLITKKHINI